MLQLRVHGQRAQCQCVVCLTAAQAKCKLTATLSGHHDRTIFSVDWSTAGTIATGAPAYCALVTFLLPTPSPAAACVVQSCFSVQMHCRGKPQYRCATRDCVRSVNAAPVGRAMTCTCTELDHCHSWSSTPMVQSGINILILGPRG